MLDLNAFLEHIVDILIEVNGLQAIVLAGSWASGTQRPDSDIDLGLYYHEASPLDIDHIRKIANSLNDLPVLGNIGHDSKKLTETLLNTQILVTEFTKLCRGQYTPKFDLDALSPKSF